MLAENATAEPFVFLSPSRDGQPVNLKNIIGKRREQVDKIDG